MAKTADEVYRKRPRPTGSEGSVRSSKDEGKSSQEIAAPDKPSHVRGKERHLAKRVRADEQSLSKGLETGEAQPTKLPGPAGVKSKPKPSPDVENLRSFVEGLGGSIGDGWHVESHKTMYGKQLVKTFVSPDNKKFRSRIEVAKHLGLSLDLPKKGEQKLGNELTLSQTGHDKDEHHSTVIDGSVKSSPPTKKVSKRIPSEHGSAGQRKEETGANGNNATAMTCSAPKSPVGIQKPPNVSVVTERCQDALRSIISTENFAALSNILNRGSPSGSLDSPIQLSALPGSIDMQLIHLRLSNGVYGLDPELFLTDIKQVWKNISAVGNELVALAQSLLEFSDKLYKQQIMSLFEVSASKDIPEHKELVGPQHDKQSSADVLTSINPAEKAKVLQNRSMTAVCENILPTQTYKSKQMAKKATKSKKPLIFEEQIAEQNILNVCRGCGLEQGKDDIECKLCKAVFHIHCTGSLLNEPQQGEWCCPLCAENENKNTQVLAEIVETCKQLDKSSGKVGVCEACKKEDDNVLRCDECEAAYHMTCIVPSIEKVPDESWYCPKCTENRQSFAKDVHEVASLQDGHNCSVCLRIPKPSSPLNKTEYDGEPEVLGGKLTDESVKHVAPKDLGRLGSPNVTAVDEPPEPHFLLGNENACKACGVEGEKAMILCSFCTNPYHLSCLKPALKRAPRSTWYCPSCLCRVCKVDADDDKILLCDTCDEGYHTYCLKPPLNEKPKGAWFCPSCVKPEEVPNPPSPKQTEVSKRKRKSTEPRRST